MKTNPFRPASVLRFGCIAPPIAGLILAALFVVSDPLPAATSGTWLAGSMDGNWSDGAKWQGGDIASGVGSTLSLQTPSGSQAAGPGEILGGFTLNMDGDRTVGNITMLAGGWTNAFAMTIGGANTLTLQVGSGTPVITGASPAATTFGITVGTVNGNQGLRFLGPNIIYWNPGTMNLTGTIELTSSAKVLVTSSGAFGNPATNEILITGSGNSIYVEPPSAGTIIANDIQLATHNVGAGFTWRSPSTGTVTVSGDIYQSNPANISNFYYWSNTGSGVQRYIVSGDNSYRGSTTMANLSVLVLAQSNTAFGTGEAGDVVVSANGGIGLSGNINISQNKIILSGPGFTGVGFDDVDWAGSLFNQDGQNTWGGEVDIGATANPRIGAAAGSQLTVTGLVTGSATGGLTKSGPGTLVLTNANTYSTGTTILGGTLLAGNNQALGSGAVTVDDGATLAITQGINLGIASLALTDGAELTFNLNAIAEGTTIEVAGNQTGSGTYIVNVADGGGFGIGTYTLMTVDGTFAATGFQLGDFVPGYEGTLLWDSGTLTLTVIPEPGAVALFALGLAFVLWRGKRNPRIAG